MTEGKVGGGLVRGWVGGGQEDGVGVGGGWVGGVVEQWLESGT